MQGTNFQTQIGYPLYKSYADPQLLKKERIMAISLIAISLICFVVASLCPPVAISFYIAAMILSGCGMGLFGISDFQEAIGRLDFTTNQKIARIAIGALLIVAGAFCWHTVGTICIASALVIRAITVCCIDKPKYGYYPV